MKSIGVHHPLQAYKVKFTVQLLEKIASYEHRKSVSSYYLLLFGCAVEVFKSLFAINNCKMEFGLAENVIIRSVNIEDKFGFISSP